MADISNPSDNIISMICPALPSAIICGLMIAHVQLLNNAVVLSGLLSRKKKSNSLYADPANEYYNYVRASLP
jgi:hypothetical protein